MDKKAEELECELDSLNASIVKLEGEIEKARLEAEGNAEPLKAELAQVKMDKTKYASKGDFDSVQSCRRREENLKFKITAQWNSCSMLENDLSGLKRKRADLESRLKLEKDRIKRRDEIKARMDEVLGNYERTASLKQAAADSNISFDNVCQWMEWGKKDFNEACSYFYNRTLEIDEDLRNAEAESLKADMDRVIGEYVKTHSLEMASKQAGVSHDTVRYWYEWGSKGFGSENAYFFKRISELKR